MHLTDNQAEIMDVLWENKYPMTITEIIEASSNRSWSKNSIYKIVELLEQKGAITVAHSSPTNANYAKAYVPAITPQQFIVKHTLEMIDARKSVVRDSLDALIEVLKNIKDE